MNDPPGEADDRILRQARDALRQTGEHERRTMTMGLVCAALLAVIGILLAAFGAAPQLLGERVEAEVVDADGTEGSSGA